MSFSFAAVLKAAATVDLRVASCPDNPGHPGNTVFPGSKENFDELS